MRTSSTGLPSASTRSGWKRSASIPSASVRLRFLNDATMQPPKPASTACSMTVCAAMPSSQAVKVSASVRSLSRHTTM